ncbi:hypothetical protein DS2_16719 [Catenovulum agarivorans DS-2]|uniref:Uncharacterized protein n=1 Tax=Catenovulum agarivorans DS-2 TaxID=1328313 RepID=W7QKL9_9ALTE|nr:hypothetical protein [Catenovulum agarivorans]EWH08608.1 hypothetical protein DS2_16719 [Catenovulum agarivorans DS-2]
MEKMMLMSEVLSLPPIMQGVLGSAIFWLILKLGEVITSHFLKKVSLISSSFRDKVILSNTALNQVVMGDDPVNASAMAGWCLIHALKETIKGIIFIVIGLAFSPMSNVFLVAGCLGALFYFYVALTFVNLKWKN